MLPFTVKRFFVVVLLFQGCWYICSNVVRFDYAYDKRSFSVSWHWRVLVRGTGPVCLRILNSYIKWYV